MKLIRILVVEDNRDLLGLIVKYLQLCGWRATPAGNEEQFWHQLEHDQPDLILLDMLFPGGEGFSLISAVKGDPRYSDIPVIAMTGMNSRRDKNRCIAAGCDSGA